MTQPAFADDVSRNGKRAAFQRWLSDEAGGPDVSHLPRGRPVASPTPVNLTFNLRGDLNFSHHGFKA
jgi:hypothetical protein